MARNKENLSKAKKEKNNEFYTRLTDIEKELSHYKEFFNGKVVLCNCNDALHTGFANYFSHAFEFLGLKKLICTSYGENAQAYIYEGDKNGNMIPDLDEWTIVNLDGDGSFDSPECIEYLKEADVVVTNPPFSEFRKFIVLMMEYNKKFLVIGNGNAVTYKEIFPLIKENKLWLGASKGIGGKFLFEAPDDYESNFISHENGKVIMQINNATWFTNIDHKKRHTPLDLYKHYTPEEYPKYDNYDAIDSKTADIPMDYDGVIGVPITFLDKFCPSQFEIIKFRKGDDDKDLSINGKCPYFRILIYRVTD